jgi:hypothetical protein
VADHQFFRERANSRQLVAMPQNPRFDAVTDLLHELEVQRLPRGRIEPEEHLLYHC